MHDNLIDLERLKPRERETTRNEVVAIIAVAVVLFSGVVLLWIVSALSGTLI